MLVSYRGQASWYHVVPLFLLVALIDSQVGNDRRFRAVTLRLTLGRA